MLYTKIDQSAATPDPGYPDEDQDALRRISDEIARVSRALASLSLAQPQAASGSSGSILPSGMPSATLVKTIIRHRRARERFFSADLFCDPAWDILLDLLLAHIEDQKVSVSSLAIAASVPPTTALRWIGTMTEQGLLRREDDPFDRRRVYMGLTVHALAALKSYFDRIATAPCPVV